MATITELKAALKETLEARGVLGQLKARIRAEVFNALDDQSEARPALSHENFLINELIREYLEFNKYRYTASVLTAESGQPEVPLDRQFMTNELNVVEDPSCRSVSENGGKRFLRSSATLASRDDAVRPAGEDSRAGVPERVAPGSTSREAFLQGGYR